MPSIETISGSGSFDGATLISFSYSEDASPLGPEDLNGGTGQVTAQLVDNEGKRGSRIAINNNVNLIDEEFGSINFDIKKVSINEGLVSIVGDTVQSKLDIDVTAPPYGSDAGGYTLATAIVDYCALAGVVPNFEAGLEAKLDLIDVDFIGWQGNLWEHLKMLCAAQPVDPDDNTLLEMYIDNDELWFREGLLNSINTDRTIVSKSLSIDVFNAAQTVNIVKYETDYRAFSLVQQQGVEAFDWANTDNVSIFDSFQVNANEKITRRVKINASLESVEQPIAVQTISLPVTYGQYVIVGKDSLPLTAAQWTGQGGSVTVSLTDTPNEIEITVVGANYPELEPFSIGVEDSGSEQYPAFYVTGTGVFFEKKEYTIYTGAPEGEDVNATTIDNPFITSDRVLWDRGAAAARSLCGPSVVLTEDVVSGFEFGSTTGAIVDAFDTKFRVNKTTFNQNGISLTGEMYAKFSDFDSVWSGATFADFNTEYSGLSFNEFAVIPLTRGA